MGKKRNIDTDIDTNTNADTDASVSTDTNTDANTDASASTAKPEKKKRDIVIETIMAGGATMESLMAAADCKYESVMSIFSTLRLMGKCPVKDVPVTFIDEDGSEYEVLTYRLVSPEEWETIKANRTSNSTAKREPKKTPAEQLEMLNKRIETLTKNDLAAAERFVQRPESEVLNLRAQKAKIELQIAVIERDELQAKLGIQA